MRLANQRAVRHSAGTTEQVKSLWSPWPVIGLFLAVSLVWILGTDWLLQVLVNDADLEQRLQTLKGLAWIILVAALLYFLLDRGRTQQRQLHAELVKQQELLESRVEERTTRLFESREQLRMLTRRLDLLSETERKAIARELHDQMGSDLTSLKIDLQAIGKRLSPGDNEAGKRVEAALATVDSMYRSFRELASRLRPSVLDDYGLAAGIEWLAAEFRQRSGLHCSIEVTDSNIPPDESRDTALFRICQESLTNVLKHSGASKARISLQLCDDKVELIVEDDGRGAAGSATEPRRRLGVVGMQERAIAVGGTARVDAGANGGTRVTVTIPLELQAAEPA